MNLYYRNIENTLVLPFLVWRSSLNVSHWLNVLPFL